MSRRTLFFLLTFAGLAAQAIAEDRPTVFIHGLASGQDVWNGVVGRLTPQLAIQPSRAGLTWSSFYESQASELERQLGAKLPSSAVAVGHSNGGLVARQWSRTRDVDTVITLGAPNQGAPIVNHLFDWLQFLDDILFRITNVNNVFSYDIDRSLWWWLPAQWTARFSAAIDIWNTSGNGILSLGFNANHPVFSEMRVGSAFLASLNSSANLDREASQLSGRAAIVSVPADFYHGGPFRVLDPDHYEDWHYGLLITGVALDGLSGLVRIMADPSDWAAFDLADHLSSVAEWFLDFEEIWCRTVSDPFPYAIGSCYVNDGIVPAWSQAYDYGRLPLIVNTNGPVHTRETAESDAQIFDALTNIAHVPLRPVNSTFQLTTANQPSSSPASQSPTGRYKLDNGNCVWVSGDTGPDQCTPLPEPTGRFKFDGWGVCYWEASDDGPDQCIPETQHIGRYKIDGVGSCYWDADDDGPDQCVP